MYVYDAAYLTECRTVPREVVGRHILHSQPMFKFPPRTLSWKRVAFVPRAGHIETDAGPPPNRDQRILRKSNMSMGNDRERNLQACIRLELGKTCLKVDNSEWDSKMRL
jgi:hypothetical protein